MLSKQANMQMDGFKNSSFGRQYSLSILWTNVERKGGLGADAKERAGKDERAWKGRLKTGRLWKEKVESGGRKGNGKTEGEEGHVNTVLLFRNKGIDSPVVVWVFGCRNFAFF